MAQAVDSKQQQQLVDPVRLAHLARVRERLVGELRREREANRAKLQKLAALRRQIVLNRGFTDEQLADKSVNELLRDPSIKNNSFGHLRASNSNFFALAIERYSIKLLYKCRDLNMPSLMPPVPHTGQNVHLCS